MKKQRFGILDAIRGFSLISMILFHASWDLVYIYGFDWQWYKETPGYIWQQSICWVFIFLSGFCQPFGSKKLKRALQVFGAGLLVTAVTLAVMPEARIVFGVLTLLGSCALICLPFEKSIESLSPGLGFGLSAALFALTRNVNIGYLGFEGLRFIKLPEAWYSNLFTAYLGFPARSFFSADYFSLVPWFFLFMAGYFLNLLLKRQGLLDKLRFSGPKGLEFLGRHSLLIYLLHQPLIYLILLLIL